MLLGLYLGRRHASVIPQKKLYLSRRQYGTQDGILDPEDKKKAGFFDFYNFITPSYYNMTQDYFRGATDKAPWFMLPVAKTTNSQHKSLVDACEGGKYVLDFWPKFKTGDDTTYGPDNLEKMPHL